jgi:hypothetical protein
MSALATAILCCSPPDNWCGFLSCLSASPKKSNNSIAFFATIFLSCFPIHPGIAIFSIAVNSGNK